MTWYGNFKGQKTELRKSVRKHKTFLRMEVEKKR